MTTIRDVAAQAGVSVATVSRVMKGDVPVNDETRARVQAAIEMLDYAPNAFARSLASNRSQGVGLLISHLGGPFMSRFMATVEEALRRSDYSLMVAAGHSDATREREALRFLSSKRCDGVLVHADGLEDDALRMLAGQMNMVVINRQVQGLAGQCVYIDNRRGGYLATRHVIELGHRHIACLTGPLSKQDARWRLEGYRQAMQDAGLPLDEAAIIEGDSQDGSGRYAIDLLRTRKSPITALVAGNDEMAMGAMSRLKVLYPGIRLPDALSVVGYDDEHYACHLAPTLTTVHAPVEEMARAAVTLMEARLKGGEPPGFESGFTPTLMTRESTGPAPDQGVFCSTRSTF
ncbi:LacI family DNA-binding transcriptional regulator [Larsenimonas rhizosphaerae]|uniref:LacI family DNA-binding transcriptional regulator n=1 Tax=Larsenimonas rhizosphaerae TaxID=2944682 RepID=A0AA42CUH7_9GAMM|nr:LacI family DNA-binding transcriptional regulator [Larsenimonas rhizosphaerae]MCM2129361.1 LacI family transcriptional regulator [Larsenimonas rhizosphaerae]MCX2524016.1 LacI family DNA-binding transcriptional regulator [Larsenimonas rhizosphaerae]